MQSATAYDRTVVDLIGDPCRLMTSLARAAGTDDYVVYERPPVWTFATGVFAEVTVTATHSTLRVGEREQVVTRDARPLAELPGLLAEIPLADWRAYGIAMFEMSYGDAAVVADPDEDVLMRLIVPKVEVVVDQGRATVSALDEDDANQWAAFIEEATPQPELSMSAVDVGSEAPGTDFRSIVADVVREMGHRGLQKVVLSREVGAGSDVDVPATYLLGRGNNTPARSFLLGLGGLLAAGFSPEMIAEVSADGEVRTQPLAGTRALSSDPGSGIVDEVGADLLDDAKEVFEHAIAVRNSCHDMTAVCEPESVAVTDYMTIQQRGTVQHIGSMVNGQLASGQSEWDAFLALFPTLIGRPRAEAYELIGKFETSPRGLYGGAVLAVDSGGSLDAALVIRALFQQHGRTWLRAGVGVVPQSTPDREFEETCEKLSSVANHIVRRTPSTGT